ncbi:hypothetical protein [Rhizobium sp. S96]|uniref:hypothetical protein n=1 Tax=Rhizobium sp. S96 TaxID=3055140 RepID=UPI0025AB26C8|nr:hypothetical protein [Rhizobium sp. S96]MDM9619096.1 hypothetical protein [Rhizobium sp. S96]
MDFPKLGPAQARLMHAALDEANGFSVVTGPQREVIAARALNGKGFLSRDKARSDLWFATEKAKAAFAGWSYEPQDDEIRVTISAGKVSAETTVAQLQAAASGGSDLIASLEYCRGLLDDGDYASAKLLSSGLYEQAKAAVTYAIRVKASRELVEKARRMQAEALKIESLCYVAMADAVDEAQAKGEISKGGRPKTVIAENSFTLDEVGVDRQQLHVARQLRNAVRAEPEFIERVVEARLAEGLEPNRTVLKKEAGHAIGTKSATKEERGDQLYETPAEATRTLLALESFSATVKEPAVGRGAILRVMENAGYDAVISDLRDREVSTRHGELQQVGDFLLSEPGDTVGMDIVTNPPYGDVANAFLAHALRVHRPRKMAALLNLNFMCGFEDPDRLFVMQENPPSRVYVFSRRLPMMHRDGWDGPKASSQMNTAWFVWERNEDWSYGRGNGAFEVIRVDWQHYQSVDVLAPGAGGHVGPMIFADGGDEDCERVTPRKTLDERIEEEFTRGILWMKHLEPFDVVRFRQGVGLRTSVAAALIDAFCSNGLIEPSGDGTWLPSAKGLNMIATVGAVEGVKALRSGQALDEVAA